MDECEKWMDGWTDRWMNEEDIKIIFIGVSY